MNFCFVCFTLIFLYVDVPVCGGVHVYTYMWKPEVSLDFCSADVIHLGF